MQTTTNSHYATNKLTRQVLMSILVYEGDESPAETVALLDKGATLIFKNRVGQVLKTGDQYLITSPEVYDIVRKLWR